MEEVVEQARSLVALHDEELRELIPSGTELFDAHVHVGQDIDGFVAPLDELVAFLAQYDARGAFAFCMDEGDRHPAFTAANDRTLAAAEQSQGLLRPFARLDLAEQPVEEARRCLDLGAQGIKLHPRSQNFLLGDERLAPVFELAAERHVPILIHGGRGLPPIATELHKLVDANPGSQLIIAHGGIADLAALSEAFGGRPGVFFDSSLWNPIDLLDLFSRVPPEQVLYGSDYPYTAQPGSLLLVAKTAEVAGVSTEQLANILGGSAKRIANDEAPIEPTGPTGSGVIERPLALARIHSYLTMATPLLWTRQPDTIGVLGLALNACAERDGYQEVRERIAALISCARELWRLLPEVEDDGEQRDLGRQVFRLIHLANISAVTARES